MVLFHLYRAGARYLIWGESSDTDQASLSLYDLGETRLLRYVSSWLLGRVSLEALHIGIPLPGIREGDEWIPIPSYSFLAETKGGVKPDPDRSYPLHSFPVSAVPLTERQLLETLNFCKQRKLGEGVFAGESYLILSDFFRFSGFLVSRGQYLPDIQKVREGGYEARWLPILDRADSQTLKKLSDKLPVLLRGGVEREVAGKEILSGLLDSLVRCSVVTTLSEAQANHGQFYSAHDAWFSALRSYARRIRWDKGEELETLSLLLSQWRYPVTWQSDSETTLSFSLQSPPHEEDSWWLSIRIREGGEERPFPCSLDPVSPPSPALLLALGQASILFPPLVRAEDDGQGGYGCRLDTHEAYLMMTHISRILKGAGYEISLPDGDILTERVIELKGETSFLSGQEEDADSRLDQKMGVRWKVTLNGEEVTAEELQRLMKVDSPLTFFRGRWMTLDTRKLQDALRAMTRRTPETMTAREVVRIALGIQGHNGLEVAEITSEGWLNPVVRHFKGDEGYTVLPEPVTLRGELRPYQLRGYSWLCFLRDWGFGSCLADDMGLGKTIQTLAFLLREKERGERRPVLLIAPMSVLGNWGREIKRFAPSLTCLVHHGPDRWFGDSFVHEVSSCDLTLTTYALAYRDYTYLRRVKWAGILLDEAQNIKNPETRQAQCIRALEAEYRIALTGTPLENNVGDIWSIMDFLNPGLLGTKALFRKRFFQPIQSGVDPMARSKLRQMTFPFILRRLKTDRQIISDLPDKIEGKVFCPLTVEQAQLYQEVLESFERDIESAEGIARRGMILAVLTKLKQVCNHPANYLGEPFALPERSGKLTRLEEMLEEVFSQGESALVFTQYAEMGALLRLRLSQAFALDIPFLHGGVDRRHREEMIQGFQTGERPTAFVLSLKAGGTGLNLTRATHVFHFDRWWNPAVENQATDRAFRIGQTHRVMVHKFICSGTLEDRIDRMIEEKSLLAQDIVGHGERFLTELSNESLHETLRLDQEEELMNE